jgi:hypothetical protein
MTADADPTSIDALSHPEPEVVQPDRSPRRPADDPFYRAPAGFEQRAPGAILRTRPVVMALFGRIPQRISAWQLLYRTADLNGAPQVGVTTVLMQQHSTATGPRPLVSFQCAIDAISGACFPSYALQHGAKARGSVPQFEFIQIAHALSRGWVVSIPDHEGVNGHWIAPREPGYRALDGIRAALNFAPLGLNPSTSIGLWGYSGGGLATVWTAEMASEYAPELNIVGAVAGSPAGDPGSMFVHLNGSFFAGLVITAAEALRKVYPDMDRVIREYASPEGLALLASTEDASTVGGVLQFANKDLDDYLDVPLGEVLALPEIAEIFREIKPGNNAPAMPMFILQSVHDQLVRVADIDALVQRYVAQDVHVEYVRDRLSEHLVLAAIATPTMTDWLADRFDGRPLAPAGSKTVWSVALNKRSGIGLVRALGQIAKMLLGMRL